MNRRSLQEWRSTLIGNTYNLLTVLDVSIINNKLTCTCECLCGNIKLVEPSRVFNGKLKSCGCMNNKENISSRMKSWYINNPDKAKEKSENISLYYKEHPEAGIALGKKRSEWAKNNPEKLAEQGRQHSQWHKDNPDKVKEKSEKHSKWFKENPDKVKQRSEKYSKWCKENPGKVKESTMKATESRNNNPEVLLGMKTYWETHPDDLKRRTDSLIRYYENNPGKLEERGNKVSQWCKENPYKVKHRSELHKHAWLENKSLYCNSLITAHKMKRVAVAENLDLSDIHPDDLNLLHSGVRSDTTIRSRCPICGEYSEHRAYHIISYKYKEIYQRLCTKCSKSFNTSKYEQEIKEYISEFYSGECIQNDRSILNGKELDLYYPEKKIAIEFNGDYWHSEEFKDRDYHYNKFKLCLEKGILLVSIFESSWDSRKDDIKRYLVDLFNGKENKLSFERDNYMNNNYPSFECEIDIDDITNDFYAFKDIRVYTCGYSRIKPN